MTELPTPDPDEEREVWWMKVVMGGCSALALGAALMATSILLLVLYDILLAAWNTR